MTLERKAIRGHVFSLRCEELAERAPAELAQAIPISIAMILRLGVLVAFYSHPHSSSYW